jgi:hypothetical protein
MLTGRNLRMLACGLSQLAGLSAPAVPRSPGVWGVSKSNPRCAGGQWGMAAPKIASRKHSARHYAQYTQTPGKKHALGLELNCAFAFAFCCYTSLCTTRCRAAALPPPRNGTIPFDVALLAKGSNNTPTHTNTHTHTRYILQELPRTMSLLCPWRSCIFVAPRSHTPGRCAPPRSQTEAALVPCCFLRFRGVIRQVFDPRNGPQPTASRQSHPHRQGREEEVPVGVHSSAFPSLPSLQGAWWYHRTPTDRPQPWNQPTGSVR